jgi:hypothetical protein
MSQKRFERDFATRFPPIGTRMPSEEYQKDSNQQSPSPHEPSSASKILGLQQSIGNHAVTSRIHAMRSTPTSTPLQRTPTTRYVPVPQPAGTGERPGKVQRVAYDRLDGMCIYSNVTESPTQILMTGKLRTGPQTEDDINSHLDYKVANVPMAKVNPDAFGASFRSADVYEITTMDAIPRGKRIGQLMAYHLALLAQKAGINYIIAKNVTTARGPFYTPLGFRELVGDPLWSDLMNEVAQIENSIRTDPNADIPTLLERKEEITGQDGLMAKNTLFISTADLLQNSFQSFSAQWHRA